MLRNQQIPQLTFDDCCREDGQRTSPLFSGTMTEADHDDESMPLLHNVKSRMCANKPLAIGIGVGLVVVLILAISLPLALRDDGPKRRWTTAEIVDRILREVPLIDGHNDFPSVIRTAVKNQLSKANFSESLLGIPEWDGTHANHVDIPRLKQGRVAAQFWAAYVSCRNQYNNSLHVALEHIDLIKRMVDMYSDDFELVTTAQGIRDAFRVKKIASLIGIEGGHAIEESLAALRILYEAGVRYLTLTHNCDTPWAQYHAEDTRNDTEVIFGLSDFGEKVVLEMNRLGMMVDLSHVHVETMRRALNVSKAPVIFSHSAARGVCDKSRNVPDDVLKLTKANGGIVMVNFYPFFVNCSLAEDQTAIIQDVVDNFNHIKKVMESTDHIGVGADYCGIEEVTEGLEDVSKYPAIFEALLDDKDNGWTEQDLRKIAGLNMLRVMEEVEAVSQRLRTVTTASEDLIPSADIPESETCGVSDLEEITEPEELDSADPVRLWRS